MNIGLQRLLNQRIDGQQCPTPEAVVRWMGALQAQEYHQAVWAVGLRAHAATLAAVEQAIADRQIVRTWPMRGTIHLVPPEDAKWMLGLSAARMLATSRRRRAQLELDERILARCETLFRGALAGDKRLSRPGMLHLLEDAGISTSGQRGYHILWYLAQSGVLCMGPMEEKQQTFVLLDEWVSHPRELPRAQALAELAGRYVASHGPATAHDFAWWAGLTLADARAGLADAAPQLVTEQVDGQTCWLANHAPAQHASAAAQLHLLPGFDEYLLGYKDRSVVLAAEHAHKVVPGNNGIFFPLVVVGGRIVGTWKRVVKKNGVTITVSSFEPLGDAEERLFAAAQRYSDFLGLSLAAVVT